MSEYLPYNGATGSAGRMQQGGEPRRYPACRAVLPVEHSRSSHFGSLVREALQFPRTTAFLSNGGCAVCEVWGWKSHESCLRKIVVGEVLQCRPDMFLLRTGWNVCFRPRLPGLRGGDWPSEVGNPNGAQTCPRVSFRAFS